jgi:cytochrome c553
MAEPVRIRLRRLLPWALGLFAGGIAMVMLIAYSGIYSVAASAGHPDWLDWFFALGKERSVVSNSRAIDPPELNLTAMAPLGAAHFQGGCATCHKIPGQTLNPVYDQMLPPPPDLQVHSPMWSREQLFWIVRHGIQFTGMPAWSGHDRDDEVWSVVAFLEALPSMKPEDYRKYANGNSKNPESITAGMIASQGMAKIHLSACDRCHDTIDRPPTSPYVPRLGGQDKAYLKRALLEYRGDSRQSGYMEPIAVELDNGLIENLADYYTLLVNPVSDRNYATEKADAGRQLAEHGDLTRKIPACLSCHGIHKRPDYPRLAGQSEQFLRQQLQVFQKGIRAKTPYGAIMTTIAKRLTEQQEEAVAAFFASQVNTRESLGQ